MMQQMDGVEDEMSNPDEPRRAAGQPKADAESRTPSLSPERLTELRTWVASRRYTDPQTDQIVASGILEQGDL